MSNKPSVLTLALILSTLLLGACGPATARPTIAPPTSTPLPKPPTPGPTAVDALVLPTVQAGDWWQVSTPQEQGLDPQVIANAYRKAAEIRTIYSLLVVKNGYLVAEEYFNEQTRNSVNDVASVTKSYVSALAGIALRENYLTSLDQKMMDFFPEYATPDLDQRKYDITIRHLLQMRAGYPFDSTAAYYSQRSDSDNYMRFNVVEFPLETQPGIRWNYSSASAHILAGILTKAVGMPLLDFANQYLFAALDIDSNEWLQDHQGYYMGGGDMEFTARDMAKFGYLYLNNGLVDGEQVIPAEWIEESWQAYSFTDYGSLGYFQRIRMEEWLVQLSDHAD